jgi:hypothetical protein
MLEASVILRIVRAHVTAEQFGMLGDRLVEVYGPTARATRGLVRFHAATRPERDGHELVLVTFWASVDAVLDAFGGDIDGRRALVDLREVADVFDVAHFEVDESQLRRSEVDAAVIRLTVGRVARGADAEIQQELRGRLHELEAEMTEAYVARRIIGEEVEVAFISAWAGEPSTRSLDAPFWPDISARYDSFLVATYRPIVSGA